MNHTIVSAFEKQALEYPDALAIVQQKNSLTYHELNQRANRLAHHLIVLGIKPDAPVGLCLNRSVELIVCMLAILKAGAAYLPLDPNLTEERTTLIFNSCQIEWVITSESFKTEFANCSSQILCIDSIETELNASSIENPSLAISPNQLAYVINTSGSSGSPKCVLIEHTNVYNYCEWFAHYSGVKRQQRIDFSSNHIFDMAVTITITPLLLGLTIVICAEEVKKNPLQYLTYLKRENIDLIKLTPSYFKMLIDALNTKRPPLAELKSLILGGENLTTADCKAWLKYYPSTQIFNEYGPTETTVGATHFKVNTANVDKLDVNVPIGSPGLNMSCFVLDIQQNPVAPNEIGELYIAGSGVGRGYLNDPVQTQKNYVAGLALAPRLYKTGDLCRMNANGVLEFMGRIDHQVKIDGFRVDLTEIEKLLAEHPALTSVAVVAQCDTDNQLKLVAYYTLIEEFIELGFNHLRDYLLEFLPENIIPHAFVRMNQFPLTTNGKLDYKALVIADYELTG